MPDSASFNGRNGAGAVLFLQSEEQSRGIVPAKQLASPSRCVGVAITHVRWPSMRRRFHGQRPYGCAEHKVFATVPLKTR